MKTNTQRRHVLQGAGALIALPALESLGFRRFCSAAPAVVPPKRMVFLSFGWGVTRESWFPDINSTGANYPLSKGLAPLQRHQQDFSVIQGLENQFSNEGHWGSTFLLDGANRYALPGRSFSNTISADQVAAEQFGQHTRYTSIQLGSSDIMANSNLEGHGPGPSLAWNRQGKPVSGWNNPVIAFHRMFSADSIPLEKRQAMLKQRRSVLDTVLVEAKSVGRGLNKTDNDKLDGTFNPSAILKPVFRRRNNGSISRKNDLPHLLTEPQELKGYKEVQVMYDLLVAALQVDATSHILSSARWHQFYT